MLRQLLFSALAILFLSCSSNKNKVYQNLETSKYIKIIDGNKLEWKWSDDFPAEECEYDKENNQLRIKRNVLGRQQISYIDQVNDDKLQAGKKEFYYYLPASFEETSSDPDIKHYGGNFHDFRKDKEHHDAAMLVKSTDNGFEGKIYVPDYDASFDIQGTFEPNNKVKFTMKGYDNFNMGGTVYSNWFNGWADDLPTLEGNVSQVGFHFETKRK